MVCIIGDKYGFRPVPVTMDKNIFETLLGSVKSHPGGKHAAELLVQWYKLDENSIPAAYVLQPVSKFYPHAYKHHANDADEKKGKEERQQWWQTLETMTEALRKAANQIDFTAFPSSEMTEEDFKISVTETEITTGMNGEGVDPKYMILFIRSLKELHEMDLNNNKFTKRFVDKGNASEAVSTKTLLQSLKSKCQEVIPEDNICRLVIIVKLTMILRFFLSHDTF